jgi:hypothetical protein
MFKQVFVYMCQNHASIKDLAYLQADMRWLMDAVFEHGIYDIALHIPVQPPMVLLNVTFKAETFMENWDATAKWPEGERSMALCFFYSNARLSELVQMLWKAWTKTDENDLFAEYPTARPMATFDRKPVQALCPVTAFLEHKVAMLNKFKNIKCFRDPLKHVWTDRKGNPLTTAEAARMIGNVWNRLGYNAGSIYAIRHYLAPAVHRLALGQQAELPPLWQHKQTPHDCTIPWRIAQATATVNSS